ncbi:hypothetical protein KCU95_g8631, partial [Aureobasidium melanogenum]
LHTLSSSSRHLRNTSSASSFDEKRYSDGSRHRRSSDSAHSDFSLWSDTGDLVDQFDNEDDPLRAALNPQHQSPSSRRKPTKHVRYQSGTKESAISKNDIPIPNPPPRQISQAERILAFIMAPNDGPSRMHGLHGKKLIYFTSVFVSLGVFLFGYDQGVMSGIITGMYFKGYFNQPTRAEIGTMVAILEVGAFISSLGVGRIGDILGRRRTILYGAVVFVIGGAFQTFATGMPMMMLGRIIAGFGVGALSTIVPVYQSEISPPHNRGKLACIEFSGNIVGYASSVWVDYFCSFILVFEQAGWVGRDAILMTGINGLTYLLSTVPPWYLVDRLGRRFILMWGAVAMIISLSAISYFIYIDIHLTPRMVVIFVVLYNAAFGASWGPIPWLYPPEILPLSIRAKGASLSTASNWAFNWLVGELTPILQDLIQWRLYLMHAFFCAVSLVVVYFVYPETANVRLEDMNSIFGDASTVAPSPQTLAEAESLFSRSPPASIHLDSDGNAPQDANIPDLDIDPPAVEVQNGKPMLSKENSSEGLGGWISNLVKKGKGDGASSYAGGSGRYRRIGQDED